MNKEVTLALNYALNKGFQIHPDALKMLEDLDSADLRQIIRDLVRQKAKQKLYLISQDDLEDVLGIKEDPDLKVEYKVLSDPTPKVTSAEGVDGYNALFADRFARLKGIISGRPESKMLKSISLAITTKTDKDVYVCGLVSEKKSERNVTKVMIDDPTGSIEFMVFNGDSREAADMLLNDQLVMARLVAGKNGGFIARELTVPDVPEHPVNRSESEVYAVFLSDLHIGSKYFMEDGFRDFVDWLSTPDPVARKTRFIIIGGDLVDGVGIYPNQDKELVCHTIEEQLEKTYELLSGIPDHIRVFIIPGNHDPGRRALPQPAIPKKYLPGLWEKENITMLGNPAMLSLNGVKVCIFHGQSIDDIVKTTPGLSYEEPVRVMQHLLRARHLSPIFGSQTPIAPELEDMMVMGDIPDIFHVGHVHVTQLDTYRGVLLINSGTWQKQTPFQASVGQTPTPGIPIVVNLKDFKVRRGDFQDKS